MTSSTCSQSTAKAGSWRRWLPAYVAWMPHHRWLARSFIQRGVAGVPAFPDGASRERRDETPRISAWGCSTSRAGIVEVVIETIFDGMDYRLTRRLEFGFLPGGTLDASFNPERASAGRRDHRHPPWIRREFPALGDRQAGLSSPRDAFVGFGVEQFRRRRRPATSWWWVAPRYVERYGVVFTKLGPETATTTLRAWRFSTTGKLVAGSAAPTAFTFDSDFAVVRFLLDGDAGPSL